LWSSGAGEHGRIQIADPTYSHRRSPGTLSIVVSLETHYHSMGALINYQKRPKQSLEMDSVIPELLRSLGDMSHLIFRKLKINGRKRAQGPIKSENTLRSLIDLSHLLAGAGSAKWTRQWDVPVYMFLEWSGWELGLCWVPKLAPVSPPVFTT
jgi:hypothetical protein